MSRRHFLPVVVLLAVFGTGACGDDAPSGIEPKAWVKTVCGALTPWRGKIATLTSTAQQQLTATKTAAQTKTNLVELLGGAEAASEQARAGVTGAGVPAVEDGKQVAEQFAASLSKARDAYGTAKRAVDALPTANQTTFYAELKGVFDTLNREYAASEIDPRHIGPKELRAAFDEVPECQ